MPQSLQQLFKNFLGFLCHNLTSCNATNLGNLYSLLKHISVFLKHILYDVFSMPHLACCVSTCLVHIYCLESVKCIEVQYFYFQKEGCFPPDRYSSLVQLSLLAPSTPWAHRYKYRSHHTSCIHMGASAH